MAFSYLLKIKVGLSNAGLNLRAELQDANGTAVLYADGDSAKTAGFVEQGSIGDYSFFTDQWPTSELPFTVLIYDDLSGDLLSTTDMNEQDLLLAGI